MYLYIFFYCNIGYVMNRIYFNYNFLIDFESILEVFLGFFLCEIVLLKYF